EVRHLRDFLDFSEKFSYALPTDKRLRHHVLSLNRTIGIEPPAATPSAQTIMLAPQAKRLRGSSYRGDQDDSPEGRNPSRPSGQASHALFRAPFSSDSAKVPNHRELRASNLGIPGLGSVRPGISVK
ncbi:MAG: hypothetical protein WA850_10400, partial [Xanthobacteraceae bacterium]